MKKDYKLKNAIENLIILAKYALDNGVASNEDLSIAKKSINKCQEFIGREVEDFEEITVGEISIDDFANLIKPKK